MAVVSVRFDGTRVNSSDSNADWGNWDTGGPAGGGAPSSESQLAYQQDTGSTTTGAVNTKVTLISTTTRDGIDYDPATPAPINMTLAANRLWFVKTIVSNSFALEPTWGVELGIGSTNGNERRYCISGTVANKLVYDEYRAIGGYLITSIDPNISEWANNSPGTIDLTSIDYYAGGCAFQTGAQSAKTENYALDALDVGRGLILIGGDGADPDGKFIDFTDFDQDISSNRFGVVTGAASFVSVNGLLTLGNSTTSTTQDTVFNDSTSVVTFPDGYHSQNTTGVLIHNQGSGDSYTIDNLLIGEGSNTEVRRGVTYSEETRPYITVVGTAGSVNIGATIRNFANVELNSSCTVNDATIECKKLNPGVVSSPASITNSVIETDSPLPDVACVQYYPDNNSTAINNIDFVQTGVGHALELNTTNGTYNFSSFTFTGYNSANNQSDSAIYVSASTGTTTINLTGTSEPSVRTAGATVNFVASVTGTISNLLEKTEVRIYDLGDEDPNIPGCYTEIAGIENADIGDVGDNFSGSTQTQSTDPDNTGRYKITFTVNTNTSLRIKFINSDFVNGNYWIADNIEQSSGETDFSIQAALRVDRVFANPS